MSEKLQNNFYDIELPKNLLDEVETVAKSMKLSEEKKKMLIEKKSLTAFPD